MGDLVSGAVLLQVAFVESSPCFSYSLVVFHYISSIVVRLCTLICISFCGRELMSFMYYSFMWWPCVLFFRDCEYSSPVAYMSSFIFIYACVGILVSEMIIYIHLFMSIYFCFSPSYHYILVHSICVVVLMGVVDCPFGPYYYIMLVPPTLSGSPMIMTDLPRIYMIFLSFFFNVLLWKPGALQLPIAK